MQRFLYSIAQRVYNVLSGKRTSAEANNDEPDGKLM